MYESDRDAFYVCNEVTGHLPAVSSMFQYISSMLQASLTETLPIRCESNADRLPIYKPVVPQSDATFESLAHLSLTPTRSLLPHQQLTPAAPTDSHTASPSRRIGAHPADKAGSDGNLNVSRLFTVVVETPTSPSIPAQRLTNAIRQAAASSPRPAGDKRKRSTSAPSGGAADDKVDGPPSKKH